MGAHVNQLNNLTLPKPVTLTEQQRKLVKSTAPILQVHGTTITRVMYKNMLQDNPEMKNIFSHSKQEVRLCNNPHT